MQCDLLLAKRNNRADRSLGQLWEENFCKLAAMHGRMFTAHQIGRTGSAQAFRKRRGSLHLSGGWHALTLPDITVWSDPGEHHEIKHKDPCKAGPRRNRFGLETYRFDALVDFQNELPKSQGVYYTIHRHDLAGGKNVTDNLMDHWFTVNICHLQSLIESQQAFCEAGPTYYNGKYVSRIKGRKVLLWYWPKSAWRPLLELWQNRVMFAI